MIFDQETCDTPFLFLIDEGNADGTDLSGSRVALSSIFPGPTLFDGDGTSRVYIDEDKTAEQQKKLEEIFKGDRGGPMEIIGGLISEWLPTEITSIEVKENGGSVTANIGDFGTIRSEPLKNEEGDNMIMKYTGFVDALQFKNRTGYLAPSGSEWHDEDLPHKYETKSGVQGYIQWNGN